ncbi:unnamed protein product [Closterium sp. NIES-54]
MLFHFTRADFGEGRDHWAVRGHVQRREWTHPALSILQKEGINMLFVIGGNGTHAGALAIHKECYKRGMKVAVVGVPKTIDNDILLLDQTFGFDTAVEEAQRALHAAYVEVRGRRGAEGWKKGDVGGLPTTCSTAVVQRIQGHGRREADGAAEWCHLSSPITTSIPPNPPV